MADLATLTTGDLKPAGKLTGGGLLAVPGSFLSIARGPFAVALAGRAQLPPLTMKPRARPPWRQMTPQHFIARCGRGVVAPAAQCGPNAPA